MRKLNETEESKVKRFIGDVTTSEIVFEIIRDSFLKSRANKDVHYLAAKSLSLEFLEEAWKELDRYRSKLDTDDDGAVQIGL
jgi:hypothetical protein